MELVQKTLRTVSTFSGDQAFVNTSALYQVGILTPTTKVIGYVNVSSEPVVIRQAGVDPKSVQGKQYRKEVTLRSFEGFYIQNNSYVVFLAEKFTPKVAKPMELEKSAEAYKVFNCCSETVTITTKDGKSYSMNAMTVGEEGRNRKKGTLVCQETLSTTDIVELGTTQKGHPKLYKSTKEAKGYIIRVTAKGLSNKDRGFIGVTEVERGNPILLAQGLTRFGIAGGCGGHMDEIYACPIGTILHIYRPGKMQGVENDYVVCLKNGVHIVKESQFEAFLKQREIPFKLVYWNEGHCPDPIYLRRYYNSREEAVANWVIKGAEPPFVRSKIVVL